MTESENYPATEIITYFVQPLNVWVSVPSMLIVCRLSMFPVCWRVLQQPLLCQIIWQQLSRCPQLKKTVNNVIINFTFTCLTANESLSIVNISVCWTHIIKVWSCALVTTQWFTPAVAYDMSVTHACHWDEYEYTPDSLQWCRHRECREQLTPVVYDQWRHMSVIAEGLQTQVSTPFREEMPYLEHRRQLGWKELRQGEWWHCTS